jgi:hypothetical protein
MRRFVFALVALLACAATPATARTTIQPYIEVQQVFTADLTGHDQDAVTYTGASAGVDVTLDGTHVQGQIDYRYDHYFAWSKKFRDTDIHNGLASVVYQPTPNFSLNAAGIATRARGTLGQSSPGFLLGDLNNTQQVYAVQAGPSYATHVGDLSVNADYRFAWTRSSDGAGDFDLGPGQPVLQNNFTTIDHVVDASVGTSPGGLGLPFGWRVSGGWTRDEVHFLDAHLDGTYGRIDVTQPISATLAVEGGVGYERNRATQSAILTDADGNAILDDHRHLQADHSKKRLLSYDQDGLIWDIGVLWRPSARTTLEVRGGRRFGETVVTGRFLHQISPTSSVEVVAYDDVTSFGRQLTSEIGALPTSFNSFSPPIPTTLAGCVFGANGGQGGCMPALSSVNSNFYRSRGVYADWSGSHGLWSYGLGVGYDRRHYLAPDLGPQIFSFSGANDQTVSIDAALTRKLSPASGITINGLAAWYDSDAFDTPSYWIYGASASYYRDFSRHLSGSASVSVSSGSGGNQDSDLIGSALLSLRYTM